MLSVRKRREIYWDMYFCAVGLSQMTVAEHRDYERKCDYSHELPDGLCYLSHSTHWIDLQEDLIELFLLRPKKIVEDYWFKLYDWPPRTKLLLKAIEKTYKNPRPDAGK